MSDLVLTNVDVGASTLLQLRVASGRVISMSGEVDVASSDLVIDVGGGGVLPGIHDHHVHLYSLAADRSSLRVGPTEIEGRADFYAELIAADQTLPAGEWIRAVGYHEDVAGYLDRHALDVIVPSRPVRVQHSSGVLWVLNTAALERMRAEPQATEAIELDIAAVSTGRLYRKDSWLARNTEPRHLDLATVGAEAARLGITGFTDATPFAETNELELLAKAVAVDAIPQRVTVMTAPGSQIQIPIGLQLGPVKIVLDDDQLPSWEEFQEIVVSAHGRGRPVAVHCVSRVQTILTIAALGEAGTIPGDRIEHGSVIPVALIPELVRLGITVVSNPGFIYERGDIYMRNVEPADLVDLYRCGSLQSSGVGVAAGTDAPFGPADPWRAAFTAVSRETLSGKKVGMNEGVTPREALNLFHGTAMSPTLRRRVAVGQPADLCVLRVPLRDALETLSSSNVSLCIINGRIVADSR